MSNEKTKTTNATGPIYRVTYSFINKNGFIRNGQIAFPAKDEPEAHELAAARLASLGVQNYRITNAKLF